VQEELEDVFGGSDAECTMNEASQLKYMECCIKETLRLYPPVPNMARQISEDMELGAYKIPAGTNVTLQLVAHHRNPEFFPDPLTFDPDRFHADQSAGRHPYAFIPFSAGPRNCVGQYSSTSVHPQHRLSLTRFLQSFSISLQSLIFSNRLSFLSSIPIHSSLSSNSFPINSNNFIHPIPSEPS